MWQSYYRVAMRSVLLVAIVACGPSSAPPEPAPVVETVEVVTKVGNARFVFRASPLANLTFQLDCLAELAPCSVDAYRAQWQPTDEDNLALADWKTIRTRYDARVEDGIAPKEPVVLPLPHHPDSLGDSLRIAGFGARDLDEYLGRVGMIIRPSEVAKLRQVIERFRPRFDQRWQAARARLEAAAKAYASLVGKPEIAALVDKIGAFYRADRNADQVFELMARPKDTTNTYAQMLASVAIVEVMEGDPAARQLPVVLHELFHRWFASSPIDDQAQLARHVIGSNDPLAGPAWGLLDEVLATLFGNGLVQRAVDGGEFERVRTTPLAMYADAPIDAGAKALLDDADTWLAQGRTITDLAVVETYLRRLHVAFPTGAPPAAYLRPLACTSSSELAGALDHLQQVSHAGYIECSSEPTELAEITKHRAWGTAVLLTAAELAKRTDDALLDRDTLTKLRAAKAPMVYTEPRKPLGTLFVFVADDNAAMESLIDAFIARPTVQAGLWNP
jgi:hypothetical protein